MNKKFSVFEMCICTMDKNESTYKINPDYLVKKCVVDEEQEIAIDIESKLKYDYVRTVNGKHFLEKSYEKIQPKKKIAIFPVIILLSSEEVSKVQSIIEDLKNGKEFVDGNSVTDMEGYLNFDKKKAKRFIKRIGKK